MTVALARELAKRQKKHKSSVPALLAQIKMLGLPMPQPEYRFDGRRMWRLDLVWLSSRRKLAIEVDGGGFVAGRHGRGTGIEADAEKFAHAAIAGFLVIRVTPKQIKSGQAVRWIETLLKQES